MVNIKHQAEELKHHHSRHTINDAAVAAGDWKKEAVKDRKT